MINLFFILLNENANMLMFASIEFQNKRSLNASKIFIFYFTVKI